MRNYLFVSLFTYHLEVDMVDVDRNVHVVVAADILCKAVQVQVAAEIVVAAVVVDLFVFKEII